jgi:hypothetical protein
MPDAVIARSSLTQRLVFVLDAMIITYDEWPNGGT